MECFKVFSKDLEGRLDCFYYRPEFTKLEGMIKNISNTRLSDYILSISGGATPNTTDKEKYYADSITGIPFLRVQNLSEDGLKLENCKFINIATHSELLKRSQVKENDLITKITGVGRMAISAVAPQGFVGNINQHLVVIKTRNRETSDTIAAFLNSDIGERLAFRRTTGGTRPALDYTALKSVPIVFKPEIVTILNSAYQKKRQIEKEAKILFDLTNEIVFEKLRVDSIVPKNKKNFRVYSETLRNNRIDANFHSFENFTFRPNSEIKFKKLHDIIEFSKETWNQIDGFDEGFPYIEISNIDLISGKITVLQNYYKDDAPSRAKMIVRESDIIVSTTRPHRGAIALIDKSKDGFIASTGFVVLRNLKTDEIMREYLFHILRTRLCLYQMLQRSSGGNYPAISTDELKQISIPYPTSFEVQNEIVSKIKSKIFQADTLLTEAEYSLNRVKKYVEKIILEENNGNSII